MDEKTIGKLIKRIRNEKKISASKLGDMIGVSQQAISQYENGKRHITIETLQKIIDALEIPSQKLLAELNIHDKKTLNLVEEEEEFKVEFQELKTKVDKKNSTFDNFIGTLGYKKSTTNNYVQLTNASSGDSILCSQEEYLTFINRVSRFVNFEFEGLLLEKKEEEI